MNRRAQCCQLAMTISLAAPATLLAFDNEDRPWITTNGEAEIKVVPDEVILTLGVETNAVDMAEARRNNDRVVQAAITVARELGIDPKHIQTDYIDIEPRYDHRGSKDEVFLGYFVRKSVVITLRDISEFEQLFSNLLTAGVNYVHGIEFRTTELREHRDRARVLALRAAREKAELLAGAMGQKVGAAHSIHEGYGGWWSGYGSWWGRGYSRATQNVVQSASGGGFTEGSSLAPGQIGVHATVTVTFELLGPGAAPTGASE